MSASEPMSVQKPICSVHQPQLDPVYQPKLDPVQRSVPVSPPNQFHVSSQCLLLFPLLEPIYVEPAFAELCFVSVCLQLFATQVSVLEFPLQSQPSNIWSFVALSSCVQVPPRVLCFRLTDSVAAACPSPGCFPHCLVVILPRLSAWILTS